MAIFLTEASKVIVQGMTGAEGQKHTTRMLASGTSVVGGVNPRKAGTSVAFGDVEVPVFGTVAEAVATTGADVSVIFVPKPAATWHDEQSLVRMVCPFARGPALKALCLPVSPAHPSHATLSPTAAIVKSRFQRGMGYIRLK